MNNLLREFDDRRVWSLESREVTGLYLDYRFTIDIWWGEKDLTESSVSIQIGNRFLLRRGGKYFEVNPEQIDTVAPALSILHQPVDSLMAYRDGRLIIRMNCGDQIVVEKDSRYESRETHGTGRLAGIGMLCSPHPGSPWGS